MELAPAEGASSAWTSTLRPLWCSPGETVASLLGRVGEVTRRTDKLIATIPSLDDSHALAPAPWFEPGARWSARTALLHILAETAQH